MTQKAASFDGSPDQERAQQQVQTSTSSHAVWTVWSGRIHGIWGICGGERCLWSLWQGPGGGSLCRPLGFWSRAMPSVARNDTLFKTQLPIYCRVLEKTDHLSMRWLSWPNSQSCSSWAGVYQIHQVIRTESPAAVHHKMDVVQLALRIAGPKAEGSCMNRWPGHLCHPPPLHQCLSLSSPMAAWEAFYIHLEVKRTKLCSQVSRLSMSEQAKNRLWLHCSPTQRCPWKTAEGKIFPMESFG